MFPLIENCPRSTSASAPAFFDEQLWFRAALRDGLFPADFCLSEGAENGQ